MISNQNFPELLLVAKSAQAVTNHAAPRNPTKVPLDVQTVMATGINSDKIKITTNSEVPGINGLYN